MQYIIMKLKKSKILMEDLYFLAGKIVDSNFTIPDPNISIQTLNPVVGISNYEYETRKNDKKETFIF
jgi:hypothetical protein